MIYFLQIEPQLQGIEQILLDERTGKSVVREF